MRASYRLRRRVIRNCLVVFVFSISDGALGGEYSLRGLGDYLYGEDRSEHWMHSRAGASDLSAQTAEGRDYLYNIFTQTLHIPEHKIPPGITRTPSPTQPPPTPSPSLPPTPSPPTTQAPTTQPPTTQPPTEPEELLTYEPGVFSKKARSSDGLIRLSNGLSAKPIAYVGERVQLRDGTESQERFHKDPDAAAVFSLPTGGWIYVSNAENDEMGQDWELGGVGVIEFDPSGAVTGYRKLFSALHDNCGGGVSPWNSWVSGEEADDGRMIQVDPFGIKPPQYTSLGMLGKYESFAFDDETEIPTFYTTRDDDAGLVTRFTPDERGYECYLQVDDYDRWCTLENGNLDYLYVKQDGTIEWTTDLALAMQNSELYHTNAEGINVHHGVLYFTAKEDKLLFIIDLRTLTYTAKSTFSKGFEEQPDQIYRIPGDESGDLIFCEDGGYHPGLHVMNEAGQVYTILHAAGRKFGDKEETTGISTSPDAKHLYVSFQHVGIVYDVTRDDGRSFTDKVQGVKYHGET